MCYSFKGLASESYGKTDKKWGGRRGNQIGSDQSRFWRGEQTIAVKMYIFFPAN